MTTSRKPKFSRITKKKNAYYGVSTPYTAWVPLRIGSGVKICGFGAFSDPQRRLRDIFHTQKLQVYPTWVKGGAKLQFLGVKNISETSLGVRKGPKATYFHPRTYPEGYPGGVGC